MVTAASAPADSHLRSLLKGLSWRCTATFSTMVIAVAVTGSAAVALTIGGIEAVAKIGIYYVHERIWLRVPWGRPKIAAASVAPERQDDREPLGLGPAGGR